MSIASLLAGLDNIACPACHRSLALVEGADAACDGCGERYPWSGHTWTLIPASTRQDPRWSVWDQLQTNGLITYQRDPERNLAVGDRADCVAFSRFCGFDELVLDIGCGPQRWPAYFAEHTARTRFVGVDPLVSGPSSHYVQLQALGESLPFSAGTFRHAVFATSLDHFIDPVPPLREARRVCRPDGEIDVWLGEKWPGAPRPAISPDWYAQLERPSGAEDVFHFKRLTSADFRAAVEAAGGLRIAAEACHPVDAYRSNWFFRLAKH
jgi:SAM-dependent methyltransferase